MNSIRRTLLLSMLCAMMGFVAIAALVVDHELNDEFGEVYDAELAREAGGALHMASVDEPALVDEDDDPRSRTLILRWEAGQPRANVLAGQAPFAGLVEQRPGGSGYGQLGRGPSAWRSYSARSGELAVLVAQPLAVRTAVVHKIERRFLLPTALLALLAALAVLVLVSRGLAPLRAFAAEVSRRSPGALQPVAEGPLPAELRPVGDAINRLLERLAIALDAQQTFVADAAHELLTPLTALNLHTQALARARTAERAEASRLDLQAGLARCIRLARQLLALARQAPDAPHGPSVPLDLARLAADVAAEAQTGALERQIDLGVSRADAAPIEGDADALRLLVRNLTDNAIKYGRVAGRVDLATGVDAGGAWLRVSDDGPGIPEADRQRVFDRFFRRSGQDVEGSGLGLAIVKQVAERHGARVALASPGLLGGLDVTVQFAAGRAPASTPAPSIRTQAPSPVLQRNPAP